MFYPGVIALVSPLIMHFNGGDFIFGIIGGCSFAVLLQLLELKNGFR